ncbi:MAG: hypothetical protein DRQ10_04260 [Candidatus Hydrothermota bacterium]|nr:MAG: hypothetical protein DRQ10_04260 [Candidatus Hydrothermae bacterium]
MLFAIFAAFVVWIVLLVAALKAKDFDLAIAILILGIIVANLPLWASIIAVVAFAIGYFVIKNAIQ